MGASCLCNKKTVPLNWESHSLSLHGDRLVRPSVRQRLGLQQPTTSYESFARPRSGMSLRPFTIFSLPSTLNAIAIQNLEQKTRHYDEASKKYLAGVATDYDVLAAKVAVENARPIVIRTENLIRISRENLRFLLANVQEVDVLGSLECNDYTLPEG